MARRPTVPCSVCGDLKWASPTSLPEGELTCQDCRRERREAEGANKPPPAERKPCVVCGTDSLRGRWCAEHKNFTQCALCDKWLFSHNPDRNIYCSDKCRIDAGIGRNGQPLKVQVTYLDWKQCICDRWICQPGRRFCCEQCERFRPCPGCGIGLAKNRQRCDGCRQERMAEAKRRNKAGSKHRQRARHYGVEYEPVNRLKVFKRDGWTCGICSEPVDKTLRYPEPMSASLDHIIPMSKGGGHTYANTQCSHWICNVMKADKLESVANAA